MKFKDLEEGKKYEAETHLSIYTKKDGLLYNLSASCYSDMRFSVAHRTDFEEVVEYVSFQEAVNHMKKGGKAKFEGAEYRIQNTCIGFGSDYFVSADMELVFFEHKWILL